MAGTLQRRFLVLFAAATAAMLCRKSVPGTVVDRAVFSAVARGSANPPFFISGNGSHSNSWKLRTFTTTPTLDANRAPVVVSLGDDLEGFFQSSPPSPIDMAVIFSNMQRLGAHRVATAAVLAWDAPDPIGLMALDKAIGRFESLVMAVPLSRGTVSAPMPSAFRRASIPFSQVQGDTSSLPKVNRIPIPGTILGGENTLAGFQTLDTEPFTGRVPLLAHWEDRAVFAFPLLVALQQLETPLDDIEIQIGEFIKLGSEGPVIPIDRFGRLAVPLDPIPAAAEIPAASLIDSENLLPNETSRTIILRDDRSAAEPATQSFSRKLPAMLAALSSDTAFAPATSYPRLSAAWEIGLLAALSIILTAVCGLHAFARNTTFLTIAAIVIAAQSIAAGVGTLWLPGIPALSAIFLAYVASHWNQSPTISTHALHASQPDDSSPKENPPVDQLHQPAASSPNEKEAFASPQITHPEKKKSS